MGVQQQLALICTLGSLACILATEDSSEAHALPSFASFITTHRRAYNAGSKEYDMRRSLFDRRVQEVHAHNSKTNRLWDAAVNHLSDYTEAELKQLRGLRIVQSAKSGRSVGHVGAHRTGQFLSQLKAAVIPGNTSWDHVKAVQMDVDQQACGSCWAIALATVLQANAEINGHDRSFSTQELVSCVPNPHNCGGSGGCEGATVELGMNWVMEKGIDTEDGTPYTAQTGVCKKGTDASLAQKIGVYDKSLNDMIAVGFHAPLHKTSPGLSLGLKGWERLPENEYEPLIRAVAETGPVAVSVGASGWNSYGAGIFNGCDKDSEIDHAVTLIGYGLDATRKEKFWMIKNSWGNTWGEHGTIRLLRHEGNVHCGTDYQPSIGTGCDGGPSSVKVCGMCGILYDAVVPHFTKKIPM